MDLVGRKMYFKGVLLDSEAMKYKTVYFQGKASITSLKINCFSHVLLLQKAYCFFFYFFIIVTNRKEFKVIEKYITLFEKNGYF